MEKDPEDQADELSHKAVNALITQLYMIHEEYPEVYKRTVEYLIENIEVIENEG